MADQQQPQPQQEEMNVVRASGHELPPGFHFCPSDNEIVSHYLTNKVRNIDFTCPTIGEVDLNKIDPWDLPNEAKWGEKEWYFFFHKDRKYPTGPRVNRATKAGYWKATGKDKEIYNTTKGVLLLVGMKKTLVFYKGRAPRGDKTNWVMHEYRLEGSSKISGLASASSSTANAIGAMKALASASDSTSKDEWVVCRVFQKTIGIKKMTELANQVPTVGLEIDQNLNNIPAILVPMPLQLPMLVPIPVPMQFPILPDFTMDLVPHYYLDIGAGMPPMMPQMIGIDCAGGIQINDTLFSLPIVVPPQINFYHQMGMGAVARQMDMAVAIGQMGMGVVVAQMDMGVASAGGFDGAPTESSLSSMVSQMDEQANAIEISSMMSVIGPGSTTPTI